MTNTILCGSNLSRPRIQYDPFNNEEYKHCIAEQDISFCYSEKEQTVITPLPGYLAAYSRIWHILKDTHQGAGGWAVLKDGSILAEYLSIPAQSFNGQTQGTDIHAGSSRIYVLIDKDGSVKALTEDAYGTQGIYQIEKSRESEFDAGALIMAMMLYSCYSIGVKNREKQKVMRSLLEDTDHPDSAVRFIDNFKFMVRNEREMEKMGGNLIRPDMIRETALLKLDLKQNFEIEQQKGTLSFAKPETRKRKTVRKGAVNPDIRSLSGTYAPSVNFDGTIDGWKDLIPSADSLEGYQITQECREICEDIRDDAEARNFLLRGVPGTGKTEMCKIIANLTGLPYRVFSCGDGMTDLDLKMQIIPNGDTDESAVHAAADSFTALLPDPLGWALDPEGSYQRIAGQAKKDATAKDCLKAVLEKYHDVTQRNTGGFRYVYSSIIQSFKYGGVTEIQELQLLPSSTAAAMNSMLDSCRMVTLMSGEVIHRHPDCVLIFTTNTGLYGLNHTNQSFLSRCDILDIDLPSDAELLRRLETASGYHDQANLKKMLQVCRKCQEKAAEKSVTDGAIDFRALKLWAKEMAVHPERGLYNTGKKKFISKCTEDVELQARYFMPCLESQFKAGE